MSEVENNFGSEELQDFMTLNEINLDTLTKIDPEELLHFKGFNWRILIEVLRFSEFEEL